MLLVEVSTMIIIIHFLPPSQERFRWLKPVGICISVAAFDVDYGVCLSVCLSVCMYLNPQISTPPLFYKLSLP